MVVSAVHLNRDPSGAFGGRPRGVKRDVEVAPLHVAAHGRVIGEAVIGVREMNQVHLLDELRSRRGRFGRRDNVEREQADGTQVQEFS